MHPLGKISSDTFDIFRFINQITTTTCNRSVILFIALLLRICNREIKLINLQLLLLATELQFPTYSEVLGG